jgi:hypothetical protein
MKVIDDKITEIKETAETALMILYGIRSVDWDSLPVDTVVYAGSCLDEIHKRKTKAHFAGMAHLDSDGMHFRVYNGGRSSATVGNNSIVRNRFAIPVDLLDRLLAKPE